MSQAKHCFLLILTACIFLTAMPLAYAFDYLIARTYTGSQVGKTYLGSSVSGGGDINGDGYGDYIISDENGSNYVYSGIDGALLGNVPYKQAKFIGDVNNDGYTDMAAWHSADNYKVNVISGASGFPLIRVVNQSGSDSFTGLGDINQDGYDDYALGNHYAPSPDYTGEIRVYSGIDGSLWALYAGDNVEQSASVLGDLLGWSVASAGDVNNDGYPDIIGGAPDVAWTGTPGSGGFGFKFHSVADYGRVYSGADKSVLWTLPAENATNNFGQRVLGLGDINSDGYDDLLISGGAYFSVFSGFNGTKIYQRNITMPFSGTNRNDHTTDNIISIGDVNGDLKNDIAVIRDTGFITIVSGADGLNILHKNMSLVVTNKAKKAEINVVGDLNGDGINDLILGDPEATNGGKAWILFSNFIDTDSDGIEDSLDNCSLDANPDQLDTDLDNQGNVCDDDDDGDTLLDLEELVNGTNPLKSDTDEDGVSDNLDAFPLDENESADTDIDGIGNNADWDDDGDGVPDTVDAGPFDALNKNEITIPLDSTYKGSQIKQELSHQ